MVRVRARGEQLLRGPRVAEGHGEEQRGRRADRGGVGAVLEQQIKVLQVARRDGILLRLSLEMRLRLFLGQSRGERRRRRREARVLYSYDRKSPRLGRRFAAARASQAQENPFFLHEGARDVRNPIQPTDRLPATGRHV